MQNQRFPPRSGALDYGTNYEFLMAAYYGLSLSLSEKVIDFKLSTNNKDMGNFDDVIIEIKFKYGEEHLYALQLKHCAGKKNNITINSFLSNTGDFSLKKYCNGYMEIKKNCRNNSNYKIPFENFHFILYTNEILPKFVQHERDKKTDVDELKISKKTDIIIYRNDKCVAQNLLNLSEVDNYFIYKFRTEKQDTLDANFLKQFILYTKQKNAKEIECLISKLIWNIFRNCDVDVVTKFLNFFKNWWRGDFGYFKLSKKDIILKLVEYVLTPQIPDVDFQKLSYRKDKSILFSEIIANFDVITIEDYSGIEEKIWALVLPIVFDKFDKSWIWSQPILNDDKICLLKDKKIPISAQGENFIDQSLKKIYTVLWHMDTVPMFIKADDKNRDGIIESIKLCQNQKNKKKFIILDEKSNDNKFEKSLKIFKSLNDLTDYRKIVENFKISLQGRQSIPLQQFIQIDNRLLNVISVKEIIQMFDDLIIGDDCKNNLPKYYITRRIPKILLTPKVVDAFDKYLFVIDTDKEKFKEICLTNPDKNCHHFRTIDSEKIEWLESKGSIKEFKRYQLNLSTYKQDDFVTDVDILEYFGNKINVICADPGMGKSVILKFLKYKCLLNSWVVIIRLNDHIKFLKEQHSIDEVLDYFLKLECENRFVTDVVKILSSKKKILFLWDGFDELPQNCVNFLVSTIQKLSSDGYLQWIAARSHSMEFLENTFNVFALTLTQFDNQNQHDYIYHHLKEKYGDDKKIEQMLEKLDAIMSSSLKCDYFDYTGVPLQIYMVMEIFLKDPKKYLDEFKIIILTDLYQEFIEGKFVNLFKRAIATTKSYLMEKIRRTIKDKQLIQYEIAALKASFSETIFSSLNLNCDIFLQELSQNKDDLGLIFSVNDEKKPIFAHKTYEEFLTASWLVKNYRNYPDLAKILFHEDYRNIRLMFDMLLAKDSPVHVAVIYGNLSILEKYKEQIASCKDKGGRNPLHIACSWGKKHFPVKIIENNPEKIIISTEENLMNSKDNLEIIDLLLDCKCNPFEEDDLIKWNSIKYAVKSLSLSAIERILCCNNEFHLNQMRICDICTYLYHSIKFNYPNLFNQIRCYPYIEIKSEHNDTTSSLLQFAGKMNRLDFVRKLLTSPHYQSFQHDMKI